MTTVRQLYELQELDLEITQCSNRLSSIDSQMGERAELVALHDELETQRASQQHLRLQHSAQDLEVESLKEKLKGIEGRLYGGTVTNLRELEGFEREATFLRDQLKESDDKLLELMMGLEEAQGRLQALEDTSQRLEEEWRLNQAELAEERRGLEETLKSLESRRQGLTVGMAQQELKRYDDLRLSKGGVAIAKVERGLCRGCRMALPTHQLQRARAGRETVFCNSCGRILYVS